MSRRGLLAGVAVGLLTAGGLLVAVAPGAGWMKPRLARAVQQATGRALTIDGTLRVGWGLAIDASDVGFANMPGGSRPMMAHVGRIHASVAWWPLLHGQFRVTALRLIDPQILIERDAAGVVNWRLQKPASAPSPAGVVTPSARRWQFRLDRVVTEGGSVAWHDALRALPDGQRPLPAVTADFAPDGATSITARDEPAGGKLRAALSVGPGALHGADAPFTATATLGDATAGASGTVSANGTDLAASVTLRAPDLAALAGRAFPGGLSLDAQVTASRQRVALTGLRLAASPGDVAGEVAWAIGPRPSLTADLAAQRLDVTALRAMLGPVPPSATTSAAAPAPPAPPHVIPDRPLPFAALDRLDADLRLRVATLVHPDLRDVSLHLLLHDGRLTLDPLGATAGGRLDGSVRVDARQPVPTTAMTLHAPTLAVAALLQAARLPPAATGNVALDADLHAAGRTPHELAATLTGTARLQGAGVTVDPVAFAELLRAARLPPLGGAGAVTLRCLALGVDATAGHATVAPLLLDSARLSLQGEGSVDLGAETLALQLRPMLRSGPGIVIPLRVSGSWRGPKLASDLGGSLGAAAVDPCAGQPNAVAPAAPVKAKSPKPIDILRGLLR